MIKLHEHQDETLQSIYASTDSGRIVIPTGGGKTLVEAYSLRNTINEDYDKHEIHLVLAPRIALANQLIREYRRFIGQNYLAVAFHSGKNEQDYEKVKWFETSTTVLDSVLEENERAKRMKKHLVIFSTYHSSHKLNSLNFKTLIADESQYCVAEGFFHDVQKLNAERKLYFTATERHTDKGTGRGLNNVNVFGNVIYQVAPKTLIQRGIIVPPRLHIMKANASDDDYSIVDEVINIAKTQIDLTTSMPVRKILFALSGTNDVKTIIENVAKIKAINPSFKIFTIVSNSKYGAMVDGNKMGRGDFMKELREADDALIFHYDILSEGIDIDGITGVAILRNMKHAKLLQTIGRAVRVYKANPSLKTCAWVSVSTINSDTEWSQHVSEKVIEIRDGGFEVNIEDIIITDDNNKGIPDDEDLDDVVSEEHKNKLAAVLEDIEHSIETQDKIIQISNMSNDEIIDALGEW